MPYSCWMTATSLWFSNSLHAETDAEEPLTSSPMTRLLSDAGPSHTRTTPTSAPWVPNPLARAELNVASPHGVGGYVLSMPKLGAPEYPRLITGNVDDGNVVKVVKVIPTGGCHLRVRLERLLGVASGRRLTHPGLAGF